MKGKESVVLHMQSIDAKTLELFPLFRSALRTLGDKMKTGEKFDDAKDVLMFSWAVTQFDSLVRNLGFEIDTEKAHPLYGSLAREYNAMKLLSPTLRRYKNIEPSLAIMTKEDFILEYGSPTEENE